MKIISKSSKQTKQAAAKLAEKILRAKNHKSYARVVALIGDLGAGKTTFIQGFAKALGIKHRLISPTFIIFRSYKLKARAYRHLDKSYKRLYHFDLYRIQKPKELSVLGFKEIISDSRNIVLIEWADRIKKVLPKDVFWLEFSHGRKETERIITYRR